MSKKRNLLILFLVLIFALGTLAGPGLAQQDESLPLAEEGPHAVGLQGLTFIDGEREDREFQVALWYPAIEPEEPVSPSRSSVGFVNAEPDVTDAPYPLIIYSHSRGGSYGEVSELLMHLTSHGFVVASIGHRCDPELTCLIDRPLDVLFVLDELAEITEGNLGGVIDANLTGVMGYYYGSHTALMAAGARIDPEYFLEWSANRDTSQTTSMDLFDGISNGPTVVDSWDEITEYMDRFHALEESELWPPIEDERIRAVLPSMPVLGMLFGERGLESVTVPTMIFAATNDRYIPYEREVVPVFAQLGAADRYMISFVGHSHGFLTNRRGEIYYKHFSTAFFGYYLQGQERYDDYLSQAFVEGFDDLDWGVYEGE